MASCSPGCNVLKERQEASTWVSVCSRRCPDTGRARLDDTAENTRRLNRALRASVFDAAGEVLETHARTKELHCLAYVFTWTRRAKFRFDSSRPTIGAWVARSGTRDPRL